jgi:hypothetical protein
MATTKSPTEEDRKKSDIDVDAVTAGVPQGDRPGPPFRSFFYYCFPREEQRSLSSEEHFAVFECYNSNVFCVFAYS